MMMIIIMCIVVLVFFAIIMVLGHDPLSEIKMSELLQVKNAIEIDYVTSEADAEIFYEYQTVSRSIFESKFDRIYRYAQKRHDVIVKHYYDQEITEDSELFAILCLCGLYSMYVDPESNVGIEKQRHIDAIETLFANSQKVLAVKRFVSEGESQHKNDLLSMYKQIHGFIIYVVYRYLSFRSQCSVTKMDGSDIGIHRCIERLEDVSRVPVSIDDIMKARKDLNVDLYQDNAKGMVFYVEACTTREVFGSKFDKIYDAAKIRHDEIIDKYYDGDVKEDSDLFILLCLCGFYSMTAFIPGSSKVDEDATGTVFASLMLATVPVRAVNTKYDALEDQVFPIEDEIAEHVNMLCDLLYNDEIKTTLENIFDVQTTLNHSMLAYLQMSQGLLNMTLCSYLSEDSKYCKFEVMSEAQQQVKYCLSEQPSDISGVKLEEKSRVTI